MKLLSDNSNGLEYECKMYHRGQELRVWMPTEEFQGCDWILMALF